jgi:Tol biopolymer transport system component
VEAPPQFIGQTIGNYRILEKLGSGGMGAVYRAEDTRLDRQVAVKVLLDDSLVSSGSVERFRREARAASSLNHPNICTVYDAGDDNGIPFLVMELLNGQTLAAIISAHPLDTETFLHLSLQICDALQCAHEKGLIHRDLKPSNIFVTARGDAKLLDFGLAKKIEPQELDPESLTAASLVTQHGQLLGTAPYMSPEQAEGKSLDARSDIFSLGAVLYEMATGIRAFRGNSSAGIIAEVLRGEPRDPKAINPQLPAELPRIISKAMDKTPADRYQSAAELMVDLRRLKKQLALSSSGSIDMPPQITKPRHAKFIWMGAAAALALIAVIALAIFAAQTPAAAPLDSGQITFSPEPKRGPLFTDGSRVYFESRGQASQMSVNGGVIAPMPILGQGMTLLDISTDASKALAWDRETDDNVGRGTLWEISMLGGGRRKLSTPLSQTARWSPDGKSLAYADLNDLYIGGPDGSNPKKIWTAPGIIDDFSYSPDGSQVSVAVSTADRIMSTSLLWRMNSDGSNAHLLLPGWPDNVDQSAGQWTPDGHRFLFNSNLDGPANVYELVAPPWFAFWKKPTAVRLTGNQLGVEAAVPARDSRSLFVLADAEQGAMLAYDPASKKLIPYLNDFSALEFIISPDRQWMAYTQYPTGYLWKSKLDGSDAIQLTKSPAYMEQWSPDSKSIAYMDWDKIYVVSADGGAPDQLMPGGHNQVAPSWAPDGKSIYFNIFPFPDQPLSGIRVVDLATRQVTNMPGGEKFFVPAWSPDGKYLVAIAQAPARMMLYNAETKAWSVLTNFDDPWGYWVWANDSKSIFMATLQGHNGMYQISVPDGKWTKLSDLDAVKSPGVADAWVSLTANGQPAIMSHIGVGQIYSLRWK